MKQKVYLCWAAVILLLCTSCGPSARSETSSAPIEAPPVQTPVSSGAVSKPEQPPELEHLPEPKLEWEWQKDMPDSQGLDGGALPDIHAVYDGFPLLSAVIVKNGRIVDEYYKEGYDETSLFQINSASKSITGALIGLALDQGYIDSLDSPISEYFPQVLEPGMEAWQNITIWNLLTNTSGVHTTDDAQWNDWRQSEHWVDYIFDLPILSKPGAAFRYSTGNTHLLCAILQKATGMTAYEFGKKNLFDPIGMDSAQCGSDPQGITDGGNGFQMNVYDMAKFGQLYLNQGVWEGRQIIPSAWVEESTRVQFNRSSGSADYGYQWWVRTFGAHGYDAYFAQGFAGQFIFVVPQLELVVVFTSEYTGSSSIYWQLVGDIVAACEE